MTALMLLAVMLILGLIAFFLGRSRSFTQVGGDIRKLHSLPSHYGWHAALRPVLPGLGVLILWLVIQPMVMQRQITPLRSAAAQADATAFTRAMDDVRRVADGLDRAVVAGVMTAPEAAAFGTDPTADMAQLHDKLGEVGVALGADLAPETLTAAQAYRDLAGTGAMARMIVVGIAALAGLIFALRATKADLRARNRVERILLGGLMLASSIAILTTIGIVWSMFSESLAFFRQYPITDFFFGLTWSPNFK